MPSKKQKLSVYLTDDEYQNIKANAQRAGLSFSRFAKMVCLGQPVKNLEAKQAILELIHFRADLGRLGGLLKLWLSNKDNHAIEVRRLLRELDARQEEIKRVIKKLEQGFCTGCADRPGSARPRAATNLLGAATPPAGQEPGGRNRC